MSRSNDLWFDVQACGAVPPRRPPTMTLARPRLSLRMTLAIAVLVTISQEVSRRA